MLTKMNIVLKFSIFFVFVKLCACWLLFVIVSNLKKAQTFLGYVFISFPLVVNVNGVFTFCEGSSNEKLLRHITHLIPCIFCTSTSKFWSWRTKKAQTKFDQLWAPKSLKFFQERCTKYSMPLVLLQFESLLDTWQFVTPLRLWHHLVQLWAQCH